MTSSFVTELDSYNDSLFRLKVAYDLDSHAHRTLNSFENCRVKVLVLIKRRRKNCRLDHIKVAKSLHQRPAARNEMAANPLILICTDL